MNNTYEVKGLKSPLCTFGSLPINHAFRFTNLPDLLYIKVKKQWLRNNEVDCIEVASGLDPINIYRPCSFGVNTDEVYDLGPVESVHVTVNIKQ